MSIIHHRHPPTNCGLPLFEFAERIARKHHRAEPLAATWLRYRHPMSAARAKLVAELAGFPVEG